MSRLTFTDLKTFDAIKIWESEKSIDGTQSVGAFQLKGVQNDYFVFPISENEKAYFEEVTLRPNERLFRYETTTTRIGKLQPLIKINMVTGLVYFLKNHTERVIFANTAAFPIWINFNVSQK